MNNNVKFRYEELLKLYPELYNIVPKNLIAAYLGVFKRNIEPPLPGGEVICIT